MTREEAIAYGKRVIELGLNDKTQAFCNLAISALSEELSEDGTLTVHVSDGSKVNRVFVMGDNIFGGLYYPDSAENKGDTVSRVAYEQIMWERDTAIQQLKDLGYGLGEKPKENKGEWIYQEGVTPYKWRCNKCEKVFKTDFNFCPNCGADMREPKGEKGK